MQKYIIIIVLVFYSSSVFTQQSTISLNLQEANIKIDGKIEETEWFRAQKIGNFVQYEPYNAALPTDSTEVMLLVDANSLYVAAKCYVHNSELLDILTSRDNLGQSDYFGMYIDPYCSGTYAFAFFVTAVGVQVDFKIENEQKNYSWDAVWFSAVEKHTDCFVIEMRIPFFAFRLPKKQNQVWNINFFRYIQQKREMSSWNYIDNSMQGEINQMGKLIINGKIDPPNVLSIIPYISTFTQTTSTQAKYIRTYSFGTDLKYSLNESFTLDVMLIPDFSDVKTDDPLLNLSPYEVYYSENRYFFTEGTEIFNKGNIFYSRRIGKRPSLFSKVPTLLNPNEIIVSNPSMTNIFNALKLSGRTSSGLGIGFLNAITSNTFANILDTITKTQRKILTEPFANYNVAVVDLQLPFNSYTAITNTLYSNFAAKYFADVTAWETLLRNKKNSFSVFIQSNLSNIKIDTNKTITGYSTSVKFSKTSGNFRIYLSSDIISKQYNPNDLGFLQQNNIITNALTLAYNRYQPRGIFLMWRNSVTLIQQRLYEKMSYILTTITFNTSTKLMNNLSLGGSLKISPDSVYDYFEPRAEDRYYIKVPEQSMRLWLSTNYANPLAYDFSTTGYFAGAIQRQQIGYYLLNSFRVRLANNFLVIYTNEYRSDINNLGYVGKSATNDTIFFGKRNIFYTINTLEQNLIFTKNISLTSKIRHYWSRIKHTEYYRLTPQGYLYPLTNSYKFLTDKNVNYNAFNIDISFLWYIRPGTVFSASYKKQIISTTQILNLDYYDNFNTMFNTAPHQDGFILKLTVYINANLSTN